MQRKYLGEIHINKTNLNVINERYSNGYNDCFTWDILHKHAGSLYKLIYENKIYLGNIPESPVHRIISSYENISLDCSAFEFEFRSIFGDTKNKTIDKVLKMNKQLLINSIHTIYPNNKLKSKKEKSITFQLKIYYALEEYKNCLLSVKKILKINLNHEAISKHCKDIRNDVDHGLSNLNYISKKEKDKYKSLLLFKALIYAMQLRKAGFDDYEIDALLKNSFSFYIK